MSGQSLKPRGITVLFVFCSLSAAAHSKPADTAERVHKVNIDHLSGSVQQDSILELNKREIVEITINRPDIGCFSYNNTRIEPQDAKVAGFGGATVDRVVFRQPYDGTSSGFRVTAEFRPEKASDPACKNSQHAPASWDIPVTNGGWALSFNGAYNINTLTDRELYLSPSQVNGQDGFTVMRDKRAEDSVTQSAAIMVHLFRRTGLSWWVPISMGVGVGDDTEFYLGTGARFGEKLFLTLGHVTARKSRAPTGLPRGSFTTDANALSETRKRRETGFFLSLSYSFGGVDVSKLAAPFKASEQQVPQTIKPASAK